MRSVIRQWLAPAVVCWFTAAALLPVEGFFSTVSIDEAGGMVLTPAPVAAAIALPGGGGESDCNDCNEDPGWKPCPFDPSEKCFAVWHTFHIFDDCFPWEDCRQCLESEDGGCHEYPEYHLGECEDAHPTECPDGGDNFAARVDRVTQALAVGDLEVVRGTLASTDLYDAQERALVLRSACNLHVVQRVRVPRDLAVDFAEIALVR